MSTSKSEAGDAVGVEVIRKGTNPSIGEEQMKMSGLYTIEVVRDGVVVETRQYPNVITTEGRRHILQGAMTGGTDLDWNSVATTYKAKAPYYVFLTDTVFTPVATQTYAASSLTEFQLYDETARPTWKGDLDGTLSLMTNSANKAVFTVNGAGGTLQGAGVVSATTKGNLGEAFGTAQTVLVSYSTFTAPITVTAGDVVNVTIALSLT